MQIHTFSAPRCVPVVDTVYFVMFSALGHMPADYHEVISVLFAIFCFFMQVIADIDNDGVKEMIVAVSYFFDPE